MAKDSKHQNRLANSQSPYLLQHATNPVDWYPWGDEAFEKAKKENKPIFLSIGYSTCHWCHVMEHESFEDSTVAAQMNNFFVSIKVDREEMPEVDHLYMSVCQAMTGRGGWPLTIVMTPDKEPFFSGTYFPKQGRGKQPGMLQLIPSLANAWSTKQGEITKTIDRLQTYLTEINTSSQGEEWDEAMIRDAFSQYASSFDPDYGGFGKAPKFPSPHNLIFLLRYSKLFGVATGKTMVEKTLHQMRLGGVFDHIGLGFHRYSTDKRWFLPHFEKMLYDQAMISMAFLEAYQITNNENYANVAREIFTYVLRDMTDKDGGFYSAEDADSEGEEGIFYIWTQEELVKILGEDDGLKLAKTFGFINGGNFFEEASGQTTGNNIPYFQDDRETLAKNADMSLDDFNAFIEKSRQKLFEVREKRIHPLKDDKILTDWNGLMIAALSQGGQVLGDEIYIDAAKNAVNFVLESLRDGNGRLMKRSRLGKAGLQPHLDDYSFMVFGLLNLYEATFDPSYLASAVELTEIMIEDFSDKNGGFFIGSKDAEKLMVRAKDSYDGAIPSGNSVAALNLFRLGKITGNTKWTDLGYSTLKAFTDKAKQSPTGFAHMMTAFMFDFKNPKEVVLVGDSNDPETQKTISAIRKNYSPNKVLLFKDVSNPGALVKVAPWTKDHVMINESPTFYICKDFACKQPTTSLDLAMKYMNE
ncbi:MAG: thioredoxin domain-containing protein [Candidatus Marinimicrobia bacterium]|nr:thioredoxin domain-containing protein [Candidatus Neomarinimicrobiota bacterium]